MPNINVAYQWAVNACNASNIGYSQQYRRGQTVNGITYYDCSSFISKALTEAGFFSPNPWFTTRTEEGYLLQVGFKEININEAWRAGDVVLRSGHTEMVYQGAGIGNGGITMGAHSGRYPLPDQVSINNHVSKPSAWTKIYRYGDSAGMPLEWIHGNRYLTDDEMKNNAYVFYSTMFFKDFTLNAIAGMLGNMEIESNINPELWQSLKEGNYNGGYGLVQWTPATVYTNWANAHGYDITDGYYQCIWLDEETVTSGQWIETSTYPISWEEFRKSTKEPDYLASVFLKNFERAGVEKEEDRKKNALKWYAYLQTLSPYPIHPHSRKRKIPLYFFFPW